VERGDRIAALRTGARIGLRRTRADNESRMPVASVPEPIAYARTNPGKLDFANSGTGGARRVPSAPELPTIEETLPGFVTGSSPAQGPQVDSTVPAAKRR
jgi:hypothetical protein